jgi:hypothetical protein
MCRRTSAEGSQCLSIDLSFDDGGYCHGAAHIACACDSVCMAANRRRVAGSRDVGRKDCAVASTN